jgi:hypothetical protein
MLENDMTNVKNIDYEIYEEEIHNEVHTRKSHKTKKKKTWKQMVERKKDKPKKIIKVIQQKKIIN